MSTFESLWQKLSKSKKYREEYALALLKRSVALQIRTLRKKHCGSQSVLAERARLTQGVVSRAEDLDYGNLTFNTVGRIAGGLDMAFLGIFVPFSRLAKFSTEISEEEFEKIPTFDEEVEALERELLSSIPKHRPHGVRDSPPSAQYGIAGESLRFQQNRTRPESAEIIVAAQNGGVGNEIRIAPAV